MLAELGAFVVFKVTRNQNFSKSYLQQKLLSNTTQANNVLGTTQESEDDWLSIAVLHPYVGFVHDPTKDSRYNRFGWLGDDPLQKKSQDKIIIALFGGSVANQLFDTSKDILISELKKSPQFKNKQIEILCLALSGYKQPQQLLALNYLLSLGAEFDVIVNLDGFNEVALPYRSNYENGISPTFPRYWNLYSHKGVNEQEMLQLSKVTALSKDRQIISVFFSQIPLKNMIVPLMTWNSLNELLQIQAVRADALLQKTLDNLDSTYQVTGPSVETKTDLQLFTYLVDMWKNSSEQMNKISVANGIKYFHFLQPNQYVDGSKTFSKEEIRVARNDLANVDSLDSRSLIYQKAVQEGYPLLIEAGRRLNEENIKFVDLTQVFGQNKDIIYVDSCCHYNLEGNAILARQIAETIRQSYSSE